jgi:hypothetical protein
MKVVGHVEQMRLSECYQRSTTLTCTTCHDPHDPLSPDEQRQHYRETCLQCHMPNACGIMEVDPRRRELEDNCVACHMPPSETDIPHVAFTHHRIAVHSPAEKDSGQMMATGTLVPHDELPPWPESERERFLGLAYFELLGHTAWMPAANAYRGRARDFLERRRDRGNADGETLAALAKLEWEEQSPQTLDSALEALQAKDLFWYGRQTALQIAGREYLKREQPGRAIRPLEQLVKLRRHSDDWTLLAISRAKVGDLTGAKQAIRRAIEIQPFRADVRGVCAEILNNSGEPEEAARQAELASQLISHGR